MRYLLALFCTAAFATDHPIVAHDEFGVPVEVAVYDSCIDGHGMAFSGAKQIYICHNPAYEFHELAHIAGMHHSAWYKNAHDVSCAAITSPGFNTGYKVGDLICIAPGGRGEFIEREDE